VRLIAEVKKASPSRGMLAATLDPVGLATTYARHGADAISVLTDEKYFHGHLDLLAAIRGAVSVPLLRKDFTLAEYQLWESRVAGADAVLLIVSILERSQLRDLLQAARVWVWPPWSSAIPRTSWRPHWPWTRVSWASTTVT